MKFQKDATFFFDATALCIYYKAPKYINFLKFIKDIVNPNFSSLDTVTAETMKTQTTKPAKKLSPKYEELARYLRKINTDLRTLFKAYDKTCCGKITADQFCRGLVGFPSAVIVCRLAMDKQTKLVDYRQLQRDLDSIGIKFVAQEAGTPS